MHPVRHPADQALHDFGDLEVRGLAVGDQVDRLAVAGRFHGLPVIGAAVHHHDAWRRVKAIDLQPAFFVDGQVEGPGNALHALGFQPVFSAPEQDFEHLRVIFRLQAAEMTSLVPEFLQVELIDLGADSSHRAPTPPGNPGPPAGVLKKRVFFTKSFFLLKI